MDVLSIYRYTKYVGQIFTWNRMSCSLVGQTRLADNDVDFV